MAGAQRYTTAELAELETRIASAAERAWRSNCGSSTSSSARSWRAAPRSPRRRRRSPRSTSPPRSPSSRPKRGWVRPEVEDGTAFEIRGGRHPMVEAALGRARAALRRQRLRARRGPHLARHRPQHGRQEHLSAAERADRDPGADGLLRAGALGADRHRRPAVQPGRRRRRSGARPLDLHGRDGRDRGDPEPGGAAQLCHPRRDRPRHRDLRRPVDRLGGARASARGQPLPRAVRDALPRADRARRQAAGARLPHDAGQGMEGRGRLPARGRRPAPPTAPTASMSPSSPACRRR